MPAARHQPLQLRWMNTLALIRIVVNIGSFACGFFLNEEQKGTIIRAGLLKCLAADCSRMVCNQIHGTIIC